MKNVSDGDKYWLLEREPGASHADIENFLERVAIACCDAGMGDERARNFAFNAVFLPVVARK